MISYYLIASFERQQIWLHNQYQSSMKKESLEREKWGFTFVRRLKVRLAIQTHIWETFQVIFDKKNTGEVHHFVCRNERQQVKLSQA